MFWKQRRFVGVCRSLEEISAQVKTNMKPDTLLSVLILLFLQFVVPAIAIGTTLLPIILVPQSKQNSVPAISTSPQPKPTCQENEYGPDCTFCLAHDTCQDGHYTCDTNTGAKICLDGWKGYTCTEKDVSLESYYNLTCPDNRCRNRGECMSGTCCCRAGFTGVLCQIEIIECQSRPCQNGGTCRDLVGDYECSCRSGFTGKNCEAHLSVNTPSPVIPGVVSRCDVQRCDNGGTCYQDSKSTYCLCPLWYSGKRCETSLRKGNVSQSNKCAPDLFGTNCTTHCSPANSCDKGHYICDPRKGHKICLVGWMGARCDIRRLPQHLDVTCPANLTCKNGGQCFEGECCCKNHYSGRFCNIETIGCHSNPCLNSGTCVPGAGNDTDNYNCSCTKSFQGEFCEKHVLTTNISMHAASTSSSPTVAYTSTTRLPGTATTSARGNTNTVPAASKVVSASTDKTETGLFTTSQQKTIHHTTAIFSSSGITTDNNFSTSIETSTPETTGFYSKTQQHTVTNSALGTTDTDLSSSAIATGMSTHKVPVKPLSTASVLHTAFVSTVLSPIASIHLTFSKPITESATTKETNLFSSTFETTSYRPTTYKPHSTFENAVVSSSPSESTSPISTSAFIKHTAEPFTTIDNVSNTQTPFATTTEKTSSEFELTSSHYTESMKTSVYSHNTKMPSAESTVSDSNSSLPVLNTTESQSMTTMEILQKYFTTHSSTHVPPQVLSETSSTGGSFSVTADTLSSTSGANTTLFSTTASTETTQNSLPSESSKTGETTPSGMLLSSETLPASSFGWTEKIATSSAKKQSVTPLYTRVSASESRSKLNVSRSSTTPKVHPMSHNSFSPQTSIGSAGTTHPSGSSLTTSNTSPTDLISSVAPVTQFLISTIRSVNSHPTDPSPLINVLDKDYSTRNSISSAKPGFNGLTTLSERPSTPLNATTSSPLYLVSTTSVLVSFNNNASTLNHFTRIKNGSMSSTRPTSLSPNNLPTDKTTPSLNYTHVPLTNSSNETSASGLSKNVDEDSSTWWIIVVGIIAGVIFLIAISILFAVIFKFILTRESRTLRRSPEEIVRFDKEHFSTEPDFENPVYLDEPDFQDDTIKSDIYVVNR